MMTIEDIRQAVESGATPVITCEAAQLLLDEIDRLQSDVLNKLGEVDSVKERLGENPWDA